MSEPLIIYKSIVGSRTYGLEVENSDIDLAVVTPSLDYKEEGYDVHTRSPERFISRYNKTIMNWVGHQWLFPAEFLLENDLSKYPPNIPTIPSITDVIPILLLINKSINILYFIKMFLSSSR